MAEPAYLRVFGHEDLRQRLSAAIIADRLPQSLIFQGPRGIGKQRLALWTAAAINCSDEAVRPCGACRSCRLASRLAHPDIHWFFPLPRPKRASGPDQMRQKLEELRASALQERRENRFYLEEWEGPTGIYIAAAHTMRGLVQKSPAMGPNKVLVIGRAETLISQMGSDEAANALLKPLEEPPADTTVVLTSAVPGALLPTIRSRVQAVRMAPLSVAQVREFLVSEADLSPGEASALAASSGGSIGRALASHDEEQEAARQSARDLVQALFAGGHSARLAAAHAYRAFGARGTLTRVLTEMTRMLRDLLADRSGAPDAVLDPGSVASISPAPEPSPEQLIQALDTVEEMRLLAERNVNPQLIVANLLAQARVA